MPPPLASPSAHPPLPSPLPASHAPDDVTHARLVSALVHLLFALGFRGIRTETASSTCLLTLGDATHRPDVIAHSGHDTRSLFSVETSTSLYSERAANRLHALASTADDDQLWLAVPPDIRPAAIRRLRDLQISARVIGV